MLLNKLNSLGLITPPAWLPANTHYLAQTGSTAYGVSTDNSDVDIMGFCVPPREMVFPHLAGNIPGFGSPFTRFTEWQQHHVVNRERRTSYDLTVYSIVDFFNLCMMNNPNLVNAIFVPDSCVLHASEVGRNVRANRKLFLHKGAWAKYKGYAYKELSNLKKRLDPSNEKRAESVAAHGYDTKSGYHIVRVLGEAEMILTDHDLDLQRNRELLKNVRSGHWSLERLETYLDQRVSALEAVYLKSTLREQPATAAIRALLLNSLEAEYGSLDAVIQREPFDRRLLHELTQLVERFSKQE